MHLRGTRLFTTYAFLKFLHVSCVALTGTGFALRGIWMLRNSPMLARRWVRVLPHVVDTALLASAIALAVATGQYPLAQSWLTAKVLGLLAYVILGAIALRRGRTLGIRITAFSGALAAFAYIVAVALTKLVVPFGS
jgi:uncharacterized membrane protein SirB2